MAKRKKRKEPESNFMQSAELTGLLLILIGIIGLGFGWIGSLIKQFAMFLAGEWWMILLFVTLLLGLYMLIKRKNPKYFTPKLIGIYILFLIILSASHFNFVINTSGFKNAMKVTFEAIQERIASISENTALLTSGNSTIEIGGGLVGALIASGLYSLFGKIGFIIVDVILAIFGLILLFNLNIGDIFENIINKLKNKVHHSDKEVNKKFNTDTLEYEEINDSKPKDDDKIVITSVDELKSNHYKEISSEDPIKSSFDDEIVSGTYKLPPLKLLEDPVNKKIDTDFTKESQVALERVLADFGIIGKVVAIHIGPAVTQYEVTVPSGTKVSRILSINKEIALALAAKDVRIQAPIPGKSTIGVEIPNPEISMVKVKEILGIDDKNWKNAKLLVALGKDIMGNPKSMDIAKTPHLLVAGATGSGKSVCINTILVSLLMRYRPDEVKIVLVDPKKVELSNYNGVPHLLTPVVTDPKKASIALQKMVSEMERRYGVFEDNSVKNIEGYNEFVDKQNKKNPDNPISKMPYIVVIIDELADLMLVASKEVEDSIMRITQMARAAGIHLIVATQRPSTDIITGVVKSNIPSRISFAVSSQIDSRTILDMGGAEKLLGKGDMLYLPMGENIPTRIQGCYISDNEIAKVIDHCVKAQKAKYDETIFDVNEGPASINSSAGGDNADDAMYDEVVEFAIQTGKISASLIQRRFRFGYNRAARMIDLLEERGIVGPQNGSKPREVLIKLKEEE